MSSYADLAEQSGRGRAATSPRQIPARGWKPVLRRVRHKVSDDDIGLVSAGVAFYGLLALFPALAALVSVYGLLSDPAQVTEQFSQLRTVLPGQAYELLQTQLQQLTSPASSNALGVGLILAILLALWSATKGTKSLIKALNIAYDEHEERGFLRLNAVAFTLTLFLVLLGILVVGLIVALPIVLNFLGLGAIAETAVNWLRWPLLAAMVLFGLAVIYRYAPDRRQARWQWVSWGSGIALLLWLIASGLFSYYVSNFGNYNATYGSIGAVIILLMWLFITALVMLLGAELNAELERQTARDTTYQDEQAPGQRGAYVADHIPGE
ncbi:MAG: YihY/virulence factor BrkB family protein [Thiogranum sp.]|nr:YihY/virulence factor BrkB family protein [Thiogranum sp.]